MTAAPPSSRPRPDPDLVEALRREVAASELQILELKDRMLAVNTDRADAVALLGQAELLLEQKINYIITLDQALNSRIKELEQEIERKTVEIDRRSTRISEIEQREKNECATRDSIIQDLSERLESANQEITRAHDIAGQIDQKRAAAELALNQTATQLAAAESTLAVTQSTLETQTANLEKTRHQATALSAQVQEISTELSTSQQSLKEACARVTLIQKSLLWRLARPWRALFGPKP